MSEKLTGFAGENKIQRLESEGLIEIWNAEVLEAVLSYTNTLKP